tara:strand:+ start:13 stop:2367 length:2355 start_codon:yes stop_codon:yes gene_type:complete
MNDMDEQSVSMGGKSTYFSGKFEKYSWKNLMDTKTSGVEKVKLYEDAVEQMYNNENLPELFREIFKNSFLPFKDPSTLNMFLKEINEFNYSNSEKLGDAFEYLLSFMGSQGDAGQFRTPRHIIDFIVKIVNPQKNETILDPACGTAGFLISSYKHILNQNTKKNLGDGLTASDRKKIGENLNGYDISPDMVKISLVNMYLHKFTNPKINEYDTLSSEERWNEYYDVILANPPFFSPKGGITPHNRFGVKSTKAEVLFVDYINEHLKPNGRAGIIVPEGIIFQSGTAYKQLRKRLIETSLIAVISLPSGIFSPYSGVKTSVLVLDKNLNKKDKYLNFINIGNDGYSLDVRRSEIKGSQLPSAIDEFRDNNFKNKIEKSKILNDENFSLIFSNYEEIKSLKKEYEQVKLKELVDIKNGYAFKSSDYVEKSSVFNFRMSQIRPNGLIDLEHNPKFLPENYSEKYKEFLINEEDVVIAMTDMASDPKILGLPAVVPKTNFKLLLNQRVGKFINIDESIILKKYLCYILKSNHLIEYYKNLSTGGLQLNLNKENILKIKIPLPSIETQKQIVEELDNYQKIIDGCRQVVEHYKPSIDIDPSCETVKLQDIATIQSGGTPSKSDNSFWENGNIPWVGSTVCKDDYVNETNKFITEKGLKNSSAKVFLKGTTLIALVGATIGKTGFLTFECATNQNIAGLYPKDRNKIDNLYLFYICQTLFNKFYAIGEGKFRMANLSFVKNLDIPLPSLEEQKKIIKSINEEREIINSNKKLITINEKRIQNKINSIWSN